MTLCGHSLTDTDIASGTDTVISANNIHYTVTVLMTLAGKELIFRYNQGVNSALNNVYCVLFLLSNVPGFILCFAGRNNSTFLLSEESPVFVITGADWRVPVTNQQSGTR